MGSTFPLFPDSASTVAGDVDALYFFALSVSAFSSLLIAVAIIILATTYRRRHVEEIGHRKHAPEWLEIAWTVVPLLVMLFMFGWGAKVYFHLSRPPADAVEFYGIGRQWMWKFQHPEGNREINELHVPIGQKIKIRLTSEDVIHALFLPAFRVKTDVVPGRYTTLWFEATKTGTYHLFCAEYCGVEHSRMIGRVVVMEKNDYQAWLVGGPAAGGTVQASGESLFSTFACNTCHRDDSAARAPVLNGLFGKDVQLLGGGSARVDDNYLRESILEPGAKIVAGYQPIMPTFKGRLSEDQLQQLIAYVKSLSGPQT
jgi:cytochrome c oxidase subunit 2